MLLLENRILQDGKVYPGNVLKVDSFLNHQMDVSLFMEMGKEFERLYHDCGVNKILTIEASGIGVACIAAQYFGCPVVFAKKAKTTNISADVLRARVVSYTHHTTHDVIVSREYLHPEDRILIIDDFLATGEALNGLISLVEQAGATLIGAGICVEKAFQSGGRELRARGIRVESLARIESMSVEDGIRFC